MRKLTEDDLKIECDNAEVATFWTAVLLHHFNNTKEGQQALKEIEESTGEILANLALFGIPPEVTVLERAWRKS